MLAVPLTQAQIDEACRLHGHLTQWRESDDALIRLHETVPGFDTTACLLKSVAVNTLYGTQVLAIVRMARYICEVMAVHRDTLAGPGLVQKIAALPTRPGEKQRHFVSFAAKFCHFFINQDLYPIYDEAARDVLKLHLGPQALVKDESNPYRAFCGNLALLRERANVTGSGRDLDRYLWITGMYMKWVRQRGKPKQTISVELRDLFEDPNVKLDALLPSVVRRGGQLG